MRFARYEAMNAQRFDPMRRMKKPLSNLEIPSAEVDMGQVLRRLSPPSVRPSSVVGGVWSDHELVLVPLEVSESPRDSLGSGLAESITSTSSSESTPSSSSSASYFTISSPSLESTAAPFSLSGTPSSPVGTHPGSEELIVTRTIIPIAQSSSVRSSASRPSSPPTSSPGSPFARPNSPVFQALNCFRAIVFDKELDNVQQTEPTTVASQPVLQVIVTQTRQQYEQDLAFKEVVQEIFPEAGGRR